MTPEDILALARQGNPKVIAAIMNKSAKPHGIYVQAVRRDGRLYVLLEGTPALNLEAMVSFVQTSLRKLRVAPIQTVKIYGRQAGQKTAAWQREIQINAPQAVDLPQVVHESSSNSVTSNSLPDSFDDAATPASPESDSEFVPSSQPMIASPHASQPVPTQDAAADQTSSFSGGDSADALSPQADSASTAPVSTSLDDPWDSEMSESAPSETNAANAQFDAIPANDSDQSGDQSGELGDRLEESQPVSPTVSPPTESTRDSAGEIEQFERESGELSQDIDFAALLKRPEALVLVAFAIALLAWQFYLSLLEDIAPEGSLSTRELAERLQVSRSTLARRKSQPDFIAWSQQLDPDAIAWVYREGAFIPQLYQPD
ncbi:MAG: hypothetical protein ACFE0J_23985, partial [Elainellaceae cyanobacterium]